MAGDLPTGGPPRYEPFEEPGPYDPFGPRRQVGAVVPFPAGAGAVRVLPTPFDPPDPNERIRITRDEPPPLDPQDRIRQGFTDLRIEDRRGRPDPAGFLQTGNPFDPAERRFSMVPRVSGYSPEYIEPLRQEDQRNPIAQGLGIQDINLAAARDHAKAVLEAEARAKKMEAENNELEQEIAEIKRQMEERSRQMQEFNARQRARREAGAKQ